jgi:uncharacterized membrane protein YeiH
MTDGQFQLPIQIDLAATFLFGLTGALAAIKRGYDVIGLFMLAFVTAVGGGLIRDGLFIQSGPPVVATDSRYIIAVVLSGVMAVLFRDHITRLNRVIALLDALGLGAYAVVGVQKALLADLSTASALLVGVINATGGGLLRDVLVRDEPLLFKPGQYYSVAALSGCVVYLVLVEEARMTATDAAYLTIGFTFLLRVLTIQFNWTSRAVMTLGPPAPPEVLKRIETPPPAPPPPPPPPAAPPVPEPPPAAPEPAPVVVELPAQLPAMPESPNRSETK